MVWLGRRVGRGDDGLERSCVFCEIVQRKVNAYEVFRDTTWMAFLDRRPLFFGHCLLIPLKHCETLEDLPEDLVEPLFSAAKLLARAVQTALQAEGSFVAINNRVSQSVNHLHIHVVPRRRSDGLKGFFWPRRTYESPRQAILIANTVRSAVERLRTGTD
jgi:histidine triad (HIT) family protein